MKKRVPERSQSDQSELGSDNPGSKTETDDVQNELESD